MQKVFENLSRRIIVRDRKSSTLRYSGNFLILKTSKKDFQQMIQKLDTLSQQYKLKINITTLKVTILDKFKSNQLKVTNIAGYKMVELLRLNKNAKKYVGVSHWSE